jgi:archaellum component FlaG (FlaF/FlaG flagellin family)
MVRELPRSRGVCSNPPKSGEAAMASASEKNPQHHTQKMKKRLEETVTHLRQDIDKVDDPQLAAMFETAAEVLTGLVKAFGDYEKKNEAAWRKTA